MSEKNKLQAASSDVKCVLLARGPDAFSFLQGQFSQDLRGCAVGGVRYGFWLNQKGKVVADSFLLRIGDEEWLVVSRFCPVSSVRARLEEYLIADEVELVDLTMDWAGVVASGEAGALTEAWGGVVAEGNFRTLAHGHFWAERGKQQWFWAGPRERVAAVMAGAEVVSLDKFETTRVLAGVVAVPMDLGADDLPQEAGLEHVGVSFNKGCYLGQEVMARLHAMGQVKRRLLRVAGEGAVPEGRPRALLIGEKRVGELRSAVAADGGWVGLAMLNLFSVKESDALGLEARGALSVRILPGQF